MRPPKAIHVKKLKKLDIYVFGEGSAGELGLGSSRDDNGKKPVDVKRPRLNHLLPAKTVGVVRLAVGGMHCAALTHDNEILTWGVNDQGALGRETAQKGKMKDVSSEGLNPFEAEPGKIDHKHFPEDTKFAQLVASDSATFVVTDTGLVYGWGTFRVSSWFLQYTTECNTYRAMMASWGSSRIFLSSTLLFLFPISRISPPWRPELITC